MMKKFIRSLILFIPFVILTYIILIIIWGSIMPSSVKKNLNYCRCLYGHTYSRLSDAKKISNVDILFLGSSHAYRGFDCRIFQKHNYSSFNLGSSGQTPIQTLLLVKRYIDLIKPKMVVYEVYPGGFGEDGVESALDVISNDFVDFETLKMTIQLNNIKTYNTFAFASFHELFNFNKNTEEPLRKDEDLYIENTGYVEKDIKYNYEKINHKIEDWKLDSKQIKAFDEALQILNNKNIPFVLVQAPMTKKLLKSKTNNNEIDQFFKNRGSYFNFNHIVNLNDTLDYYDPEHLNQNGVVKFNEELIKFFQEKKIINN